MHDIRNNRLQGFDLPQLRTEITRRCMLGVVYMHKASSRCLERDLKHLRYSAYYASQNRRHHVFVPGVYSASIWLYTTTPKPSPTSGGNVIGFLLFDARPRPRRRPAQQIRGDRGAPNRPAPFSAAPCRTRSTRCHVVVPLWSQDNTTFSKRYSVNVRSLLFCQATN